MASQRTIHAPAPGADVGQWDGERRPRRSGVTMGAVLRRWWLVLIPAIALGAAGVAAAERRPPVWTATSQLNVGKLDVQAQALPGFVQAAQQLASSYSRFVESPQVLEAVADRTRLPPATVADRLTAKVVPASPVFGISADGPNSRSAVALVEVATNEVQKEVARLNTRGESAGAALGRYRSAAARAERLARRRSALRTKYRNHPSPSGRTRLDKLTVDANAARLRADALGQLYQDRVRDDIGAAQLDLLTMPSSAKSDRLATLQLYGFVGFAGGLLIGLAMATVLAARRAHRLG